MKTVFALALPLFLAALACAPMAHAAPIGGTHPAGEQAPRTVQLADISVGPDLMAYRIPVSNCGQELSHLKIKVQDNAIYLQDITVVAQGRSIKAYNMNRSFALGYESPWLDLGLFRPSGTCVTQITVNGQAADDRVKARVIVMGIMAK